MNINYFYGKTMLSNEGKNYSTQWSNFIKLFEKPIVQNIEYNELQKLLVEKNNLQNIHVSDRTKEQRQQLKLLQDKISNYKNVHYIIGGNFSANKRTNGDDALLYRNLIALDIDNCNEKIWEKLKVFDNTEYLLHSSFSHSPEKPKLRLFIPINNNIRNKHDYINIVTNIITYNGFSLQNKDNLDGDIDQASTKFNQLMFLPNIPKNGEYILKHNKGEILNINDYKTKENTIFDSTEKKNNGTKIQSPYDMKDQSIIKKFCIKYNIHQCIKEFLSDIYIDRKGDRYTYSLSSSKHGAIVYSDQYNNPAIFLYSNHGSDPLNDYHCHNSFDLIKEYKFGGNIDKTIEWVKTLFPQPVNKKVDIFEKINQAISDIKKNEKILPLADGCFLPVNYKSGYYMVKQGFCKRYIFKQTNEIGNKEEIYVDKILIPIKIYPTKIIHVEEQEIEFNNKIYMDNDSFSSIAKFKTWLKQFGKMLYFDGDTKDITGFEKYIKLYAKFADLKIIQGTEKLGWSKDFKSFNPYTENSLFIKDDKQFDFLLECFEKNGNYEIWKENVNKYNNNDIFRLIFNTSLSSPLVKLLRRPPVWVHHYEAASTGKTPAAYAAASIWAKPGENYYTPNFNITRAGIEFLWHTLNNLPCILQDTQNLDKSMKDKLSEIIYDMFNGSGKIRGNIVGKNHKIKIWNLSMITNGEQKILQGNEFEGATKRLIEISGLPFKNTKEAKIARDIFQDNYGFYGEDFIKIIIKYKKEIKDLILQIEDEISNDINIETHIESISTLIICDYLFNVYCMNKEKEKTIQDSINWGLNILKLLPLKADIDKTTLALSKINEFVLSNTHRFRLECPQGRVGFFQNGIVYFFPEELKILLKKWDIPQDRFFKDIKEMDIVLTDNKQNFKPKFYNNRTIRPIAFNNIDLEGIENIDEYR